MYASVCMCTGANVVTNDPNGRKREREQARDQNEEGKRTPTIEQRLQNDCGLWPTIY